MLSISRSGCLTEIRWSVCISKYQRIIIYSFSRFPHQRKLIVSHWSLSDSNSPQVFQTLFSILADPNNAVVCIVFIRPNPPILMQVIWCLYQELQLQLISPSLSCSTVFQFSSKVQLLFLLFAFFQFYSVVRTAKSTNCQVLLIITRCGCLAEVLVYSSLLCEKIALPKLFEIIQQKSAENWFHVDVGLIHSLKMKFKAKQLWKFDW